MLFESNIKPRNLTLFFIITEWLLKVKSMYLFSRCEKTTATVFSNDIQSPMCHASQITDLNYFEVIYLYAFDSYLI